MAGKKTILVPHAGDKVSEKGLRYAYDLARSLNAKIVLLRVVPEITYHEHSALLSPDEREELRRTAKQESKKLLEKQKQDLSRRVKDMQKKGIKASAQVVLGDPAEVIIEVTRKAKPYMVIMGGRRFEGLRKVKKLGSVTRKVAENIECGILIVR